MDAGWDTTLMTEAWNFATTPDPKKIFIEYSANDTLKFGNGFVGPTMAPVQKYFPRMTIFNGVMMSPVEVGHPSPATFAVSGASDGSEPSYVCQFMDLYYRNQSASIIANATVETAGRNYKIVTSDNISSISSFTASGTMAAAGKSGIISNSYSTLSKVSMQLNQIAQEYKTQLSAVTDTNVSNLVKGFLSQVYPAAFIRLSGSLDTHSDHANTHKKSLVENFQTIAKYLDALSTIQYKNSGKSLLDLTTVVVSSDFTRTPALNVSGGKDHNPFSNSMIVMSPKLKPEVIVGRSRLLDPQYSPIGVSVLVGMPLSTQTLQPMMAEKETAMLTPSVIFASLMDANGKINDASPDVFKKAFKLKGLYI
tara:strand:+ start:62309 stop:63406 length:1098 start_codon:yes stop_codon:yes gene_type:complete